MKRSNLATNDSIITKTRKIFSAPQHIISKFVAGTPHNPKNTGFLTGEEKENLSAVSTSFFYTPPRILQKFLLCVAHGEQNKAEELLQINPKISRRWLLGVDKFTDYSGRTFECTAFEYAYWAKDTRMCRMLAHYMDEETRALILQRIEAMERTELTCQQHGKIYHSVHFDFTPLKHALQTALENFTDWIMTRDFAPVVKAWMNIGKAQQDVPAHVAQEYCRIARPFYPCPAFNELTLPRRSLFNNWIIDQKMSWFPLSGLNTGLGFDFSIVRADAGMARGIDGYLRPREEARLDLLALNHLDEVRTQELVEIRENLKLRVMSDRITQQVSIETDTSSDNHIVGKRMG